LVVAKKYNIVRLGYAAFVATRREKCVWIARKRRKEMKTVILTGLIATFAAGTASADLLYGTSFEDVNDLGGKYFDLGDAATDHWLSNNAGQAAVNGLGFDAWYGAFDPAGVGLTDGDYVGVTNYGPGGYEGDQSYQMSDIDGNMELHFNGYEGSASMVSLAIFIADTGYEAADNFSIHWGADPINGPLYSLVDTELEDAAGVWLFLEFDVSALGAGHLHVRGASNSGSEAYYIDSVSVYGNVPAPGALALLGIAGLARRRRK
jgi:hypothetical protein